MHISRYQKLFGVGPLSFAVSLLLFCIFGFLDKALGHIEISNYPPPVRLTGLSLIGFWIIWHAWSLKAISRWWRKDELCTTGPYRFVRHPLYAGALFLGSTGISLILNSWVLLLVPLFQYFVLSLLIRKEEALMSAVFGDRYREYASHTGRLLPRLFR